MSTTTAPRTITGTVSGSDGADAVRRVTDRLARFDGLGVTVTGRVSERSLRHLLWNVELVLDADADVNDVWVILTSYGITPSDDLGSSWQQVPGVGKF